MPNSAQRTLELERLVLSLLCQPPGDASRTKLEQQIATYAWRNHDHQIIFEVLCEIRSKDPQVIREQLPARLTRKGFPDLDVETLFEPLGLDGRSTRELIRSLIKSLRATPPSQLRRR